MLDTQRIDYLKHLTTQKPAESLRHADNRKWRYKFLCVLTSGAPFPTRTLSVPSSDFDQELFEILGMKNRRAMTESIRSNVQLNTVGILHYVPGKTRDKSVYSWDPDYAARIEQELEDFLATQEPDVQPPPAFLDPVIDDPIDEPTAPAPDPPPIQADSDSDTPLTAQELTERIDTARTLCEAIQTRRKGFEAAESDCETAIEAAQLAITEQQNLLEAHQDSIAECTGELREVQTRLQDLESQLAALSKASQERMTNLRAQLDALDPSLRAALIQQYQ